MKNKTTQPETSYPLLATIGGSNVRHDSNVAVFFRAGLIVNGDGGPHCYHPAPGKGLDFLANAGWPGPGWGIALDPKRVPYIQKTTDPAPGYYVSTTSLEDPTKKVNDCARYANSEAIAYLTLPPQLLESEDGSPLCALGDFGVAYLGETPVNFIVADTSGKGHVGEASIAFGTALHVPNVSPKNGGLTSKDICYCVLPQTRVTGRDRKTGILLPTQGQIDAQVNTLLRARNLNPRNYFV